MSALRMTSAASPALCGARSATLKRLCPSSRGRAPSSRRPAARVQALFGGNKSDSDSEKGDRVTLSREEEPEEYWVSAGEKKGVNPLKDPLAVIGILAILFPFLLLGVAVSTGLIDTSVYR